MRHAVALGFANGELELGVLGGVEAMVRVRLAIDARGHDGLQTLLADLGTCHERGNLLLLAHLPGDVLFDIGMIDVDDDHFGRASCCSPGLYGAGRAITDFEEAHEAGRAPAARELFVGAAERREVRARARAVFEEARFPDPQIHDAAFADEIIGNRLNKAGVRLGVFVGRRRLREFAGFIVNIHVPLAGAVNTVGPVQAGVKPLRRIRCGHLHGEHEAVLVEEGAGVVFCRKVAALPAPIGPRSSKAVKNLAGVGFAAVTFFLREFGERCLVRHGAPQPRGNLGFFRLLQAAGDAGLAEVFLRQNIGGDLTEVLGDIEAVKAEDNGAVGILDFRNRPAEGNSGVRRLASRRKAPRDLHELSAPGMVFVIWWY